LTEVVIFGGLILAADVIAAISISRKIIGIKNISVFTVSGGRDDIPALYNKWGRFFRESAVIYRTKSRKTGMYMRAAEKMKKCGFTGENAALVYLTVKYPLAILLGLAAYILNFPRILPSFLVFMLVQAVLELMLQREKKKINKRLQKHIYKIYKYLHNQISSGVKVTDALKTAYEAIDDQKLKHVLIRLAARYELTLDLDGALDEFRESFQVHEAEMLCVALKQGVETGDNSELLARQEDLMFKKYFNYIQSETDRCKTRTFLAVAAYTAVVVVMIAVPLLNDMKEAASKIFIS
jgi:hypothetical protein